MFNITLCWSVNETTDEEDEKCCSQIVEILRDLLRKPVKADQKKNELHNNIANLLTSIPNSCLIKLHIDNQNEDNKVPEEIVALNELLNFMKMKFEIDIVCIGNFINVRFNEKLFFSHSNINWKQYHQF